jgi:hypothetical protein
MSKASTEPLIEMNTSNLSWGNGRLVNEFENLTAILAVCQEKV